MILLIAKKQKKKRKKKIKIEQIITRGHSAHFEWPNQLENESIVTSKT